MSNLQAIASAGLDSQLESIITGHLVNPKDSDTPAELKGVIDKHGLKHPQMLKTIASLQQKKAVNKGLYQDLMNLQASLESGSQEKLPEGVGSPTPPQTKETQVAKPKPKANVQEGQASKEQQVEASTPSVVDVDKMQLTDAQKVKIKEKLAKEEERMVKRLREKAEKLAQKMRDREARGAIKKGMDPEKAHQLKLLKEQKAVIVSDIKDKREAIKKLQAEILAINPPKVRELTPEQTAKKAARDAEKATRKAERDSKKAAKLVERSARKEAKKAEREAKKAARKAAREAAAAASAE